MELEGGAAGTAMTVRDFLNAFMRYQEHSGAIEPSTVRSHKTKIKQICNYVGNVRLGDLSACDVNPWGPDMTTDGYAPKSVSKPFRILKQAFKWDMSQDMVTRNIYDYCKPPKRVKSPVNALDREERTRMLKLTMQAELTSPLGIAIELALTTGMRRSEVCTLTGATSTTVVLRLLRRQRVRDLQRGRAPHRRPGRKRIRHGTYRDLNFHELCHVQATLLIGNGAGIKTVQHLLGHSSANLTMSIYAHAIEQNDRTAANAIGRILAGGGKPE